MRDGRKARSQEDSAKHRLDAIAEYKKSIELKEEEVKQVDENTFTYKGKKVSVYGEASEFNNMAIEGWLYLIPNYEEEYSVVYSDGYNTCKEAVKAVIDDSFRRFGNNFDIEEISFI